MCDIKISRPNYALPQIGTRKFNESSRFQITIILCHDSHLDYFTSSASGHIFHIVLSNSIKNIINEKSVLNRRFFDDIWFINNIECFAVVQSSWNSEILGRFS